MEQLFHYTRQTQKAFDQVISAVEKNCAEAGFRVLTIHDVHSTLAEKGQEMIPYKIIEVCNAKFAKQALDADRLVGLMLPCPINIWSENGHTTISTPLPSQMMRFFPGKGLESLGQEVERTIRRIVDESV
jgi:uncharacterized protein (DUF302 family)